MTREKREDYAHLNNTEIFTRSAALFSHDTSVIQTQRAPEAPELKEAESGEYNVREPFVYTRTNTRKAPL